MKKASDPPHRKAWLNWESARQQEQDRAPEVTPSPGKLGVAELPVSISVSHGTERGLGEEREDASIAPVTAENADEPAFLLRDGRAFNLTSCK